jgi:small subunit ribosomal protein S6
MRDYEVLFILDPTLDEATKNSMIDTVKGIINSNGEAGEADVWGNRKLAYTIEKKKEGFYVLIPFKANPDLPKELDRRMRISDKVMRHIIVSREEN